MSIHHDTALADAYVEMTKAIAKHKTLNSPHEGWAVIAEELDELWDHVRANTGRTASAYQEAIQIAAMALRYAAELAYRPQPVNYVPQEVSP